MKSFTTFGPEEETFGNSVNLHNFQTHDEKKGSTIILSFPSNIIGHILFLS